MCININEYTVHIRIHTERNTNTCVLIFIRLASIAEWARDCQKDRTRKEPGNFIHWHVSIEESEKESQYLVRIPCCWLKQTKKRMFQIQKIGWKAFLCLQHTRLVWQINSTMCTRNNRNIDDYSGQLENTELHCTVLHRTVPYLQRHMGCSSVLHCVLCIRFDSHVPSNNKCCSIPFSMPHHYSRQNSKTTQ